MRISLFVTLSSIVQSAFSQQIQPFNIASDTFPSGIEIFDVNQQKIWIDIGKDSLSCEDIISLIEKCDVVNFMYVEKSCSGRFPRLVLVLSQSGITIKLFMFGSFVDDYIKLSSEEYLNLYRSSQVYKMALFKDRDYKGSIIRIKLQALGNCVLMIDG